MESLALDYEEPIVIPDTPPLMNAPGLSDSKNTSSPSILGFKDKDIGMFTRIKIDEPSELNNFEPEICLQPSPARSTRAFTRETKMKDALARSEANLKVALQAAQDAKDEIKAFKEAEKGRFTPIPNYACQSIVDEMEHGNTSTDRQPLQWPRQFRSGPVSLPFPPSNGTFPFLHPRARAGPASFPIFHSLQTRQTPSILDRLRSNSEADSQQASYLTLERVPRRNRLRSFSGWEELLLLWDCPHALELAAHCRRVVRVLVEPLDKAEVVCLVIEFLRAVGQGEFLRQVVVRQEQLGGSTTDIICQKVILEGEAGGGFIDTHWFNKPSTKFSTHCIRSKTAKSSSDLALMPFKGDVGNGDEPELSGHDTLVLDELNKHWSAQGTNRFRTGRGQSRSRAMHFESVKKLRKESEGKQYTQCTESRLLCKVILSFQYKVGISIRFYEVVWYWPVNSNVDMDWILALCKAGYYKSLIRIQFAPRCAIIDNLLPTHSSASNPFSTGRETGVPERLSML
ncbi:hypothetical protein F5879DRAFT_924180 [Lentinula edodes]|uniref:uncharacterized protein n=1 Tax=Lentinula edodes TaxID=5353 RepID=UPI001E8D3F82|nr:uncharacterized protein C8R40DRAFT_1070343 [Lentinula edodes]KAH7874193.1 hypothetical protein C8R40DRAFT_1070343 [Lentinula edodes]KAJ3901993.1 hypothetical protein F5879DRAFT_924180 [Lentinula edodes]